MGKRRVKAGHEVYFSSQHAAELGECIDMPGADDDAEALQVTSQRVRDAGLEPAVVPLAWARDFAHGTALFGKATPEALLRRQIGVAQ